MACGCTNKHKSEIVLPICRACVDYEIMSFENISFEKCRAAKKIIAGAELIDSLLRYDCPRNKWPKNS